MPGSRSRPQSRSRATWARSLDRVARAVLHADSEGLVILAGAGRPLEIRRVDTQTADAECSRLPDMLYLLQRADELVLLLVEVQVRSDASMARRMADNHRAIWRRMARDQLGRSAYGRISAVEIRLREMARITRRVADIDDAGGELVAWRVVNALTRPHLLPAELRCPEHAAIRALVRGVTLDDLRALVAEVETAALPPRQQRRQRLLLGEVGRAIFGQEVVDMNVAMTRQTLDEMVADERADEKLLAQYQAEWDEMLAKREQKGMREGMREGVRQGMREGVRQGVRQGMREGVRQGVRQGMREGVREGMREGVRQGVRQRMRAELRRVLALCGHEPTEDELRRIERCDDIDLLDRWIDKLLAEHEVRVHERRREDRREALRRILALRGLELDGGGLARIERCEELEVLDRWIGRAVTAEYPGDVLD